MMGSMLRRGALTADTTGGGPPSPSWTLDFSSGSPWANGTDYTYSSLRTAGTYVASSGYIAPNAANLVLQSEDFSTTWTNNLTTESLSGTAPDGSATSWRIQESIGNGGHNIVSGWHTKAATTITYTISCYVKKDSTDPCDYAAVTGQAFNENTYGVLVDLSNGSVTDTYSSGTPNGSHSVTNVGSGWYRVSLTMTSTTATLLRVVIGPHRTATATWAVSGPTYNILSGSTLLNLLAWGAQIVVGSDALPYSKTTTAANGIPRLMHNSSGSRLGLLVEGGATNLLQQSAAVRTSPWVTAQFTTAGASITAPDGTVSGVECVAVNGAGSATAYSYQQITATASTAYTTSFFLKAKGTALNTIVRMQARASTTALSNLDVTFNNATGTVGSVTSGTWTATSATSTPIGNGWYRVTLTGTTPATTNNLWAAFFFDATGNGTDGVYAWGAQVEAQAFASSYIPTTAQSVTRAAETVHVPDSKITSWGDPGALVVHFYPPSQSGTLLSTDDAATAQVGIEANSVTDVRAFWSSGSTASETMTTGLQKAAHYWKASASKFCLNGGPVRSGGNDLVIGNTDFVTLGAEATDSAGVPGTFSKYSDCIVCKVEFYSGTLTDAQLQAITT